MSNAGQQAEQLTTLKRVKITLTGPHTHRGVECGSGDEIEVREDQAKRLFDNKRAVPSDSAEARKLREARAALEKADPAQV